MGLAGLLKVCGLAGALMMGLLGLRWIVRRSEERGAMKALKDRGERIIHAEKILAERLYGGDSALGAHFRVREPDAWGEGPPPEAGP